jgi:hypothetical protein
VSVVVNLFKALGVVSLWLLRIEVGGVCTVKLDGLMRTWEEGV